MNNLRAYLLGLVSVLLLASCDEDPVVVPTGLTLTPSEITLKVGETYRLIATVEPQEEAFEVTFESDHPKVVIVNADGLVTAVSEGTASVTAKVGNLSQQSIVKVVKKGDDVNPDDPDTTKVDVPDISLIVRTIDLQLEVGQKDQIDYSVDPVDTPMTFASDNVGVATVDNLGSVTAIASGNAIVMVTAGDTTATVAITVVEPQVSVTNELPLLLFDVTPDNYPQIEAHEAKVGRVEGKVLGAIPGFVNTDLTITGVAYDLSTTWFKNIYAFSRETVSDCPITMAMLEEYGFTEFEEGIFSDDGTKYLLAYHNEHKDISVQLSEMWNKSLQANMMIDFQKAKQPQKLHDVVVSAQDFPDFSTFATKDVSRIKEFESNLGFRTYEQGNSNEAVGNLFFMTDRERINESNFDWVYYTGTPSSGPIFINSIIVCVSTPDDLLSDELRQWLALNGYSRDYTISPQYDNWIEVFDETGDVMCQVFIEGEYVRLQILPTTERFSDATKAQVCCTSRASSRETLLDHRQELKFQR